MSIFFPAVGIEFLFSLNLFAVFVNSLFLIFGPFFFTEQKGFGFFPDRDDQIFAFGIDDFVADDAFAGEFLKFCPVLAIVGRKNLTEIQDLCNFITADISGCHTIECMGGVADDSVHENVLSLVCFLNDAGCIVVSVA